MNTQVEAVYCICDEVCRSLAFDNDPQCRMTDAEVMTFAVYAAAFCFGDYKRARLFSLHHRYFPKILSHSRLIQRIHKIPQHVWLLVFQAIQVCVRNPQNQLFIVDSFPIKAYENHKSFRARIFSGKEYHGYSASRKAYFFGIKVHMLVDLDGIPVEFGFTPGSCSDIAGFRSLPICLRPDSKIFADCAYTDYQLEDLLLQSNGIHLISKRRSNAKRQHKPEDQLELSKYRNSIESVFSSITSRMPRHVRARTEKGFCLKIFFFILAYMAQKICPLS